MRLHTGRPRIADAGSIGWLVLPPLLAALASPSSTLAQPRAGGAAGVASLVDSVYVALEARRLKSAAALADRAVRRAPRSPEALIARGRVHLAWPRIGRFRALDDFRRAARLTPGDPEPHYWIGRVGLALLGDDGEAIARRGLERVLELAPDYRDAWDLWLRLYRGPEDRARMVEKLRPWSDRPEVAARIAGLWVEGGRCAGVDSVVALLELQWPDPRWPARRAECSFLSGRDSLGREQYWRAVEMADRDTAEVLWAQVSSLARPDERAAYVTIAAVDRPAFYRAFWAPRDPNVRTAENERLAEHFRRRAKARERFRLQHPLSRYHHDEGFRDMVSRPSRPERDRYVRAQLSRGLRIADALRSSGPLSLGERLLHGGGEPPEDVMGLVELQAASGEPDIHGMRPEILPLGRNLPEMIDDRGLAFIRHGPPDRYDHKSLDDEVWVYESEPSLRLRFARGWVPPDPPISEMIHRPVTRDQARSVVVAMTSERSSIPAPLEFDFWFARFAADERGRRVEVVLVPERGVEATGILWDGAGRELARDDAEAGSPLRLTSPPGRPLLALDVERADSLGRYRGVLDLPNFSAESLSVSDILLTEPLGRVGPERDEAANHALPSLAVARDAAFAVYMEVYGLGVEGGTHRFQVTYEFEEKGSWLSRVLGGERRTVLRFDRVVTASAVARVAEYLEIGPGRIGAGDFDLTVSVRDLVTGRRAAGRRVSLRLETD